MDLSTAIKINRCKILITLSIYNIKQHHLAYDDVDIVILGCDFKVPAVINRYLRTIARPILLLTQGDPETKITQIYTHKVTDTLDIKKITPEGFNRIITLM